MEMREATKEERKSVSNYMKNVGVKTGIKFDIIEELEKIKAEIDLIKDSKNLIDDFDSGCERIKDLLDNHIAELKEQ